MGIAVVAKGIMLAPRGLIADRIGVGYKQAATDGLPDAVGAFDPASLSAAERRQHSGWLLREAENATILALAAQGVAIKEIMRRTDKSRGLVRQVLRGGRPAL